MAGMQLCMRAELLESVGQTQTSCRGLLGVRVSCKLHCHSSRIQQSGLVTAGVQSSSRLQHSHLDV